jgi:hypothetical protein
MAVVNHNIPVLDRKEWQMMTPAPIASGVGASVIQGGSSLPDLALYVVSATVQYLYSHKEDGWVQIPSGALAGTFGAGSCGTYSAWSQTYTATGGSTTSVTVAAASYSINAIAIGATIDFPSAATAAYQRRVITNVNSNGGTGTITLTLDYPLGAPIVSGNTFRMTTGRFFYLNAGAQATGSFKMFDVGTMTWNTLSQAGLPTWGTDGKLVWTGRNPAVYANGTATSGSTTTIVDTTQDWNVNQWAGYYSLIVLGTGAPQFSQVLSNTATTLTLASAFTTAPDATSVYQIRAQPTTSIGKATSGSATTLVNTAKAWSTNQWVNFQVRILSGTGGGQISLISANTATTLTIASGATLDSTSAYQIEPSEDAIYALGNNAVTMYKYSIANNTWSTVAPTTARAGVPSTGMNADFVDITGDPIWGTEVGIQDSRYIYSFRGGNTSTLDRFDVTGGTSGAGAWANVPYVTQELFTTGSSGFQQGRFFYLVENGTQRYFKYDIPGNAMLPFNTDLYPSGTAQVGQKIWIKYLDATGTVQWLYSLVNGSTVLRRVGIV